MKVKDYIEELRKKEKGRTELVRQATELYVEQWERIAKKGIISLNDDIEEALRKIEQHGGFYSISDEQDLSD